MSFVSSPAYIDTLSTSSSLGLIFNHSQNRPRSPPEHDLLSLASVDNASLYNTEDQTLIDCYNAPVNKASMLSCYQEPHPTHPISTMPSLLTPPLTSDPNTYYQDPWQFRKPYNCDHYCCYWSSYYDMCCSSESLTTCYSPTCHECNLLTPAESPSLTPTPIKDLMAYDHVPADYPHLYNDTPTELDTEVVVAPAPGRRAKLRSYSKAKRHYSVDSNTSSESDSYSDKAYSSVAPRRYKCSVCPKRFTRPSSLATHMHSHTGEKPYACEFKDCGRRFSVVSNLRRHAKIHISSNNTDDTSNDNTNDSK
ncbi:hypothetical protein CU097_014815 [Rhizopus azygosporus]|uniref:C2H2-type domain-containing protein n=2 Tax=Rhizopus TaxID=4842 RepID=A0A367K3Q4_RHIAZ|nr:hypothetical protein CU097_014815 [Rhizopus azygosporus]